MQRWEAFEIDPARVRAQIEKGKLDYVEVASQVAETRFFRYVLQQTPWEDLVATFPTPRKKEEVPLWLYLCSQLTLRLHGATGYGAYPYVVHCGGLKEVLGNDRFAWKQDPQTHDWYLDCEGYNNKNAYARVTPCDQDFLRKLARDTDEGALVKWFGRMVPRYVERLGLWDEEGIVIADGSYLFVPDNERYENSCVMRFDEHNHPVDKERLTEKELERTQLRRCYRMVNLVHTNRDKEYWTYAGVTVGTGKMAEAPQLYPMIEELQQALPRGRVKLVIHDRGFIDGATVTKLKKRNIDTLFAIKKSMCNWQDALALAERDGRTWQVWRPPVPQRKPVPVQRPERIQRAEEKRQRTIAQKKAEEPPPVEVDRVEMKLIPHMKLWESCGVPIRVVVLKKHFTDGRMFTWGLGTTREFTEPLEAWQYYQLRPGIEETTRQGKCFWDLTHFRSCHFGLVVNQVVFTLLAYTLAQVFLVKSERNEWTGRTRNRIWEEILPQGDKVYVYASNCAASLSAAEYGEWLLGVGEGARRRLKGRLRQIGRQRKTLPQLPPRPTRPELG